jgi:hypothetical protein
LKGFRPLRAATTRYAIARTKAKPANDSHAGSGSVIKLAVTTPAMKASESHKSGSIIG